MNGTNPAEIRRAGLRLAATAELKSQFTLTLQSHEPRKKIYKTKGDLLKQSSAKRSVNFGWRRLSGYLEHQ
jgi:hypothetical protein